LNTIEHWVCVIRLKALEARDLEGLCTKRTEMHRGQGIGYNCRVRKLLGHPTSVVREERRVGS